MLYFSIFNHFFVQIMKQNPLEPHPQHVEALKSAINDFEKNIDNFYSHK